MTNSELTQALFLLLLLVGLAQLLGWLFVKMRQPKVCSTPELSAIPKLARNVRYTTGIRRQWSATPRKIRDRGYTNPACRRADSERAQRRHYS
jgi:hypothetical protein